MESDVFYEPYLKFKVTKPSAWDFMPPAWSPVEQMKNSLEENEEHWIKYAGTPFCVAMRHHNSLRHVYPTFQVTVRYMAKPNNDVANNFLEFQKSFIENQFQSVSIIEATSKGIIAGFRTNIIKASYILPFDSGEEQINASVLSWSYAVFANQKVFIIGISSPQEEGYLNEKELCSIIESIRIGT